MVAIFSCWKLAAEDDYSQRDFETCVHILLKYGANPFSRNILGESILHYASYPRLPKQKTAIAMKIAKMCIDASHYYFSKVHKYVTLQSLSKSDFNGRYVYCSDPNSGRLVVYLSVDDEDGKPKTNPLAVKPTHVFLRMEMYITTMVMIAHQCLH